MSEPSLRPHIALFAVRGRRARTFDLALEFERRGFPGIWVPGGSNAVAAAQAVLERTSRVTVGTAIQPIYVRHATDLAGAAAILHELYDGRFRLGIGVAHVPLMAGLGVDISATRPLSDMRRYVGELRASEAREGALPPIVLATLREKMVDLSVEVADGAVWANGSQRAMATSVARIPEERRAAGFFVGNMMPLVIDDDRAAAEALCRRTLWLYLGLPNYRNYWRACGWGDDMDAAENEIAEGRRDDVVHVVSTEFVADVTVFGPAGEVRERVERYITEGLGSPILVPSATSGGQFRAFEQVFEAFA